MLLENTPLTNWYAITGAPRAGNTSFLRYLAFYQYKYQLPYFIRPEAARVDIDTKMSQGLTLEMIRKTKNPGKKNFLL